MDWEKRLRDDREKAKVAFYDIGERLNGLDRQMADLRQEQSRTQGVFLYLGQLLEDTKISALASASAAASVAAAANELAINEAGTSEEAEKGTNDNH